MSEPRLLGRGMVGVLAASFGGVTGFHLLLSVAPLYATTGGAGAVGAGLVTGALLTTTVASELLAPRLVGGLGNRTVFAAGLLLMGLPTLALIWSAHPAAVMGVSAVRGVGFGLVVVLASTLVAELAPPSRRGEGLGLLGVVIGGPGVLALPFGVYLVGMIGYPPVFMAATVSALAGLLAVPLLPGRRAPVAAAGGTQPEDTRSWGVAAALRLPGVLRPAVVFAATAMAAGVVVTFVPLVVPPSSPRLLATALLVFAGVGVLARWWAGRYGDRRGPAGLLLPSLLAAAAGMSMLAFATSPVVLLPAMVLVGGGFGVMQNASLVLMFSRVPAVGYAMVSAVWNIAFDAAMGLGAAGFGLVAEPAGYPVAFTVTGAVMLAAFVPALCDRARRRG